MAAAHLARGGADVAACWPVLQRTQREGSTGKRCERVFQDSEKPLRKVAH